MRDSIKQAVGSTVQELVNSGAKTSFTQKELNALGVKIPEINLTTAQIKGIREKLKLSQTVFAQMLNVSPSSIRQWEQGKRQPTGSTKVLLDLLKRSPHVLNYRINA
ncbi:MAG: helix-turn-helix domain-containing protein, partial [Candidatus Electrothrix sp. MAN1_4]|nr:helix-turn-helix domain-containing protein [Candidatus Electrothrix sp. MAN1_4]